MRKTVALATALTLTLTACSGSSDGTSPTSEDLSARIERVRQRTLSGEVQFVSFLRPVGDCDALLAHIHTEAAARVTAYGLPGLGNFGGPGVLETAGGRASATGASTKAAPSASDSASAAGSSPTFSGTNNQEVGVDEADIVKTDGKRIVTLTGNRLTVVPVDAGTAGATRTVTLGDGALSPNELLVAGDRALVFGSTYGVQPAASGRRVGPAIDVAYPAPGEMTVTEVDLSGSGTPKVGVTLKVEGAYLTARLVGNTVRLVVRSEPRSLPFVTPQNQSGEERARKSNQEVVLESSLDDWLANYELVDANGTTKAKGRLGTCDTVEAPTEFAGFGSLAVLTFDATKPLGTGDAVTVLSGGDTVYASDKNLYVATQTWIDPTSQNDSTRLPFWQQSFETSIHQFSIAGTAPATYVASGNVPGYLLNQFAMSEYNGVLRAASTKGAPWNTNQTSESLITTLKRNGDKLERLGQLRGLGKGERIYSVRFAEDKGYVVTFRQTDPFYTIELADPANPQVLGELKITGYSGYLHPIADDLVIGVGQEATTQGRIQGTKVSLFDVSDLANPTELAKWSMGSNSSSGAEYDHKAFLYWPATKTLVLPVVAYGRGSQEMAAVLLTVDRAKGFTEIGRVTHGVERPANVGASDCRKLTEKELEPSGIGIAPDNSMLVLLCERGQRGGAVGYQCSVIPAAEVARSSDGFKVPEGGRLEYCSVVWNQVQPIVRSLVIGSSLWTLSQQRLQANDLSTLTRTARVDL